ncbi:MAG TPA: hypothetical protein VKE93_21305 [Candidatus Angelobacter sp.]|nr:hypothetical protein [Candidatus Angelobacter sp.]
MPPADQYRRNWPLWLGTAFLLVTVGINVPQIYALDIPQGILPWLGLVVPAVAVACFVVGVRRAFAQPEIYRGRITGSILSLIALLLFVGSVWLFSHVRDVPPSSSAPKIGQKAPDFTLPNTSGQPVTLNALLSMPIDSSTGARPKAVLLVFYRGYW